MSAECSIEALPAATGSILALARELCRFQTGTVCPGNEAFFARVAREVPGLRLHRYRSGEAFNGWEVPPSWSVQRARVYRDDRLIFDGQGVSEAGGDAAGHPLAVAAQSRSFCGEIPLEALREHVVSDPARPGAYVYHCRWQYRPWEADWALCVPFADYRSWGPGRYRVELVTRREPGDMIVGVADLPGRSTRTVVLAAHTCHPAQANDDMAGVCVLIRLFQWLARRARAYTYRLVLGPEHLGTVFYLRDLPRLARRRIACGAFAEMPGTPGAPLTLASSFCGGASIDLAFSNAARSLGAPYRVVGFREGAGNDETVWEAPGYEIPFVEVSRCRETFDPFPEYHSSLDTVDRLDEDQVEEYACLFREAIAILERDAVPRRRFDGLPCLSNPRFDLYVERPDPALPGAATSAAWGRLQDHLPRHLDGARSLLHLAEQFELPFEDLLEVMQRWRDKGLVDLAPARLKRPAPSRAAPRRPRRPAP